MSTEIKINELKVGDFVCDTKWGYARVTEIKSGDGQVLLVVKFANGYTGIDVKPSDDTVIKYDEAEE